MRLPLLACWFLTGVGMVSSTALAGSLSATRMAFDQSHSKKAKRPLDFGLPARLQPQRRPEGLVASVAISPGASIGLGRFYAPPRKRVSIQDQPITLHSKPTRRTAIGLSLRF